jgi:hypothetical protein
VTVEGRVGKVKIVHRGRKVISSTSLTDASGAALAVGLPYIKLDSGGIVEGSYARITGRYSRTHADFSSPVLVPDRRNLTDDSRSSWLDWLALELSPICTPAAHHLAAAWSWVAGPDGAANVRDAARAYDRAERSRRAQGKNVVNGVLTSAGSAAVGLLCLFTRPNPIGQLLCFAGGVTGVGTGALSFDAAVDDFRLAEEELQDSKTELEEALDALCRCIKGHRNDLRDQ